MDDDRVLRRRIARILQSRRFLVETAADGAEAMEVLHEVRPHLVVTDIQMPNMDGWELVRRLRTDARSSLVPVIFLTSRSDVDDVLRGFRLGADDYLAKPVAPAELLGRVEEVMRKRAAIRRRLRPAARPAPTPRQAPPEQPEERRADLVGSVDQLGLSTLLTVLESGERTGVIRLWRGAEAERETGRVWIRAGKVIRASVTGPGTCSDADAIYYLLSWSRGDFSFFSAGAQPAPTVAADCLGSTHMLLLEGARRIDEVVKDVDRQTDALRRAFLHRAESL